MRNALCLRCLRCLSHLLVLKFVFYVGTFSILAIMIGTLVGDVKVPGNRMNASESDTDMARVSVAAQLTIMCGLIQVDTHTHFTHTHLTQLFNHFKFNIKIESTLSILTYG